MKKFKVIMTITRTLTIDEADYVDREDFESDQEYKAAVDDFDFNDAIGEHTLDDREGFMDEARMTEIDIDVREV